MAVSTAVVRAVLMSDSAAWSDGDPLPRASAVDAVLTAEGVAGIAAVVLALALRRGIRWVRIPLALIAAFFLVGLVVTGAEAPVQIWASALAVWASCLMIVPYRPRRSA